MSKIKIKTFNIFKIIAGLGLLSLLFQNFITSTNPTTLSKIAALDAPLEQALKKMDEAYSNSSLKIYLAKAYGRYAELEYEHKKMKSDLIRASAAGNINLLNESAEAGNYAQDSATLNALMNQIPAVRRNLYVVSVQNATPTSLPTRVQLVWQGTGVQPPNLFDLVLVSNVSHNWVVDDSRGFATMIRSFVVQPNLPTPIRSAFTQTSYYGETVSNLTTPIQPNTTTKAQFLMDDMIQAYGTDYRLKGNYAVSAGTTLVINIAPEAVVTAPTRGPLTAKYLGQTSYNLFNDIGMILSPDSIFPQNITASEALFYLRYFQNVNKDAANLELYWRGLKIKPLDSVLPPPSTTTTTNTLPSASKLELYQYDYLVGTIPGMSESQAYEYCKQKYLSYNSAAALKCIWNGKVIFDQPALPTTTSTTTTTTIVPVMGTYERYKDLILQIKMSMTKADADYDCKKYAAMYPSSSTKCLWNGIIFFEQAGVVLPPPPPSSTTTTLPPVVGTLELYVDGKFMGSSPGLTEIQAYTTCKGRYNSYNMLSAVKCLWNGRIIFNEPAMTPSTTTTTVPITGTYEIFKDSALQYKTISTKANADYDCKKFASLYPSSNIKCFWNGIIFFEQAGGVVPPPPPPSSTTTTLPLTGTYELFKDSVLQFKTTSTKANAEYDCNKFAALYPSSAIRCLFNGTIFFLQAGVTPPPSSTTTTTLPAKLNFSSLSSSTFAPKCLSCHSTSTPTANLDISSYQSLMASGKVIPGDAINSLLYRRLIASDSHPKNVGIVLSPAELANIKLWISNGAPEF